MQQEVTGSAKLPAQDLASRFIKNFHKYETNEKGKALVAAGPKVEK